MKGSPDDLGVVIALRTVLFFVATIANGFIIYLIVKSRKMRKEKFNLLIVLLCIGDIILGISAIFRAAQNLIIRGHYTRLKCLKVGATFIYGAHATQLAMLLIALDRLDTMFRLHNKHVHKIYFLYILAIPFVLILSTIPVSLLFTGIDDREVEYCAVSANWNIKFGYFTFIEMIIYTVLILALYAMIYLLYHLQTKHLSLPKKNNFHNIVYGVVIVYILMWCIPKWILFGLKIVKADIKTIVWSSTITSLCEVFSASVNVIVYGYTHRDLRKAMKKFFLKNFGIHIPSFNPCVKRSMDETPKTAYVNRQIEYLAMRENVNGNGSEYSCDAI
ncbi:hypothetical protein L596_015921 [Steinernema carpocapsae]|uniref:G-protein coupled receptors family 1 profile domain-containing protein n=1 Tax=Steinernema carpocapsae TaxID=34508 RepID=A0A4U5NHG8_STECR|nr:hypothetical protein L596_015921 [Steinernema carpocapsae]